MGIGLDDEPQLGVVAGAELFEQLLEPLPGIGDLDIALAKLVGSLLRDRPRLLLAPHDLEAVAGGRKLVPTHGQHGGGRLGLLHPVTRVVEHGPHPARGTPATMASP